MVEHATSTSPRVGSLLAALRERGCALAAPAVVCADVFAGAPALAAYDARAARVVMNPAVPPRHLTQHQWTRGEFSMNAARRARPRVGAMRAASSPRRRCHFTAALFRPRPLRLSRHCARAHPRVRRLPRGNEPGRCAGCVCAQPLSPIRRAAIPITARVSSPLFPAALARARAADPRHMACTEIRAANLSGDCDFADELRRSGPRLRIAGVQQECVRKRTFQSLAMHAACAGWPADDIRRVVDDVFPACYADTAPFSTN
jgi:hypothetical protein